MHSMQQGVAAILVVTDPIILKRMDLFASVLANLLFPAGILVDVVAQMHDEIEVVLGHVFVGGEQSLLVMLARSEGKLQLVRAGGRLGECPGPADRALGIAAAEAIKVPAIGLQPIDLDMDRMAELRGCRRDAAFHHVREFVVGRDLPGHVVGFGGKPAAWLKRFRSQLGPDHKTGVGRFPGGDAQRERIPGKQRFRVQRRAVPQQRDGRQRGPVREEQPAGHPTLVSNG